ncbi:fatty acyl-CoA hydrolase precursor, medium chain-like [Spea bombifrons]|uniref:fatty acyl-CoA hydrolase precursor, medium chain-like n=1 Tax=Spea bombifrons TaxID=233779 RepID=UPI002349CD97|nr:fatty acyl-CoA hydrolase precursor, medium chain-like [Spea bombifrons]
MGLLGQTLLLCCLTLEAFATGHKAAQPTVTTKYGKLRGETVSVKETDRKVDTFLGIPFAKPPVGELRFESPEPPEPWSSVRDATKEPAMCIQNEKISKDLLEKFGVKFDLPPVSEDCLYLNIFSPQGREMNSKLPVMVFIHGGGFSMGGATMSNGAALSAYENVVFVSIQYRLGIPGFFSNGDDQARGNFGFLDQVAALQWIRENIEDFGGDPESVTIFGESAGGVSVAALVLSPLSKGLFHRAIAESGVALIRGLFATKSEDLLPIRNLVANISGCDLGTLVKCLKRKTEDELILISELMVTAALPACVDGVFMPKPPEEILANKEGNNVPFMIGNNDHEFSWMIPEAFNISGLTEGTDKETVLAFLKTFPWMVLSNKSIPLVMEEYFGDSNDPLEIRDRFLDLIADIMFVMPALRTAKYHRDSGFPVYFYEFQHRASKFKDSRPEFVKADHGDELFFVLGGPFLSGNVLFQGSATEEEKRLSKHMMKYWANFARNGDPNSPDLAYWPKYEEDEAYLEIQLKPKSSRKLRENRFVFWTKTLPEKIQKISEEEDDHMEL